MGGRQLRCAATCSTAIILVALAASAAFAQAASDTHAAPAESVPATEYEHPLRANPTIPARGFLYDPSGPRSSGGAYGFRLSIGMLFDAVDTRPIQGLHAPVPQFTLNARYQFQNQVSLFTQIQTIWVMNQLELGVGWATQAGRTMSVMGYLTGGSLLGTLNVGGFNSFTAAPLVRPGFRLGWKIQDMRLTFDGSALFIPTQYVTLGDSSLWTSEFRAFTGLQGTLTLETPLSGGGIVAFGLGALWMRGWYQTWLFFSDDPSLLLYPRIFGAYVF
jgi:hypothetical protein